MTSGPPRDDRPAESSNTNVTAPPVSAKKTKAWLADHPRRYVHRPPPRASWLNQIELYFSVLAKTVIRYGNFSSREDLINKIETYIIDKSEVSKPCRRTYDGTPLKAA